MTATGNMEDAIERSRTERKESKDYTDELERNPKREHQDRRPEVDSGSLPLVATV